LLRGQRGVGEGGTDTADRGHFEAGFVHGHN
jgi:hypothetical protein